MVEESKRVLIDFPKGAFSLRTELVWTYDKERNFAKLKVYGIWFCRLN